MLNNLKLIDQILKSLDAIYYRNLLTSDDIDKEKVALELLEDISIKIGNTEAKNNYGDLSNYENEKILAQAFLKDQSLYDEVSQNPKYIDNKRKYIDDLSLALTNRYNAIKNSIPDYYDIVKKISSQDGTYQLSSNKERAIFHLITSLEIILEKLDLLAANKRSAITLPNQMLILDRLGILNKLYDDGIERAPIARLLSVLLNQDSNNINKFLRIGCDNYDNSSRSANDFQYLYKNQKNNEEVDTIFKKIKFKYTL
jgi:hypothetical protein